MVVLKVNDEGQHDGLVGEGLLPSPSDLSSIPGAHMVEETSHLPKAVL